MEFDNKSFWKFTTALGRKLSDGRTSVFYQIISDSVVKLIPTERSAASRPMIHWEIISSTRLASPVI